MPHLVEKYRRKISGPVADRIDMWVQVGEMPPEALRGIKKTTRETEGAREAIRNARELQRKRFSKTKDVFTNAAMRPKHIEAFANLSGESEDALVSAARAMKLSARGYHRTIKLARTIADLATSEKIETPHMLEALQYRSREF